VIEDFCRQNAQLHALPVRGDDKVRVRMYRKSPIDTTLFRYHLNVNAIKDRLYRLLFETADPGPGFCHLPAKVSDDVKAQLCSEEQRTFWHGLRKDVRWVPKKGGGPNHLWDCMVYATAVAELAGVGDIKEPRPTEAPRPQRPSPREDPGGGFLDGLPRMDR